MDEAQSAEPEAAPEAVSFTVRPTQGDVIRNAMATSRASTSTVAVGTFSATVGLVSIVLTTDLHLAWAPPLVFGLALLTGAYAVPFVWWTIRRRRDLMLVAIDVLADSEGVELASAVASGRQSWSMFRRARELPSAFLFETGTSLSMAVPTNGASTADLEAFRALLVDLGLLRPSDGAELRRTLVGTAIGLIAAIVALGLPLLLG